MKLFFDGMQKLMEGSLDSETIVIMEAQTAECKLTEKNLPTTSYCDSMEVA